jgi:WD40 repeat protein
MASAGCTNGDSDSSTAALQQYQACLGIMVRLRVEDLNDIKLDFDAAIASNASSVQARAKTAIIASGVMPVKKTQMSLQQQQKLQQEQNSGLSLEQFVSVMLDRVAWTPENVQTFIEDLIELFLQVDVNGDGTMTWEEFTSAIIEGGMGSISEKTEWDDMKYEENLQFRDTFRTAPPKKIQYLPELRKIVLFESNRPVIDVLDPSALFPMEMRDSSSSAGDDEDDDGARNLGFSGSSGNNTFVPRLPQTNSVHPLCYVTGYRKDQDVRSERSPVQAVKYLSKVDLIVVSSGDLTLTFWSSVMLNSSENSSPLAMVHTPRPQRVLEWNPATNHLYTISADLIISVFMVSREYIDSTLPASTATQSPGATTTLLPTSNRKRAEVYLLTSLKKHTDLLQDLLLINPGTLVSCGMDSIIYLWDTQTLTVKGSRHGHKRGVRLLAKLSSQMFLTAGFETEIFGWHLSGLSTNPIFRLSGHNAPVCCIHVIPAYSSGSRGPSRGGLACTDQAITVDDDGWFKWWHLGNILSTESEENRCIQTFRLGKDQYPWKCHSLISFQHGKTLVAAGYKLKCIQRVRLKPTALPSCCIIYNDASFTLLTTTEKEFRIWDASTGRLLRTFRNITKSDICCVELDARQRKIVFGNANGELFVLNYLNGALLKSFAPHRTNVSALVYCKEDKCVLTASWDKSIRLYDDDSTNPLLRCIIDAHESDIKCLAYSYSMALFASGETNGTIKLWDYVYFLLEDECLPMESAGDVSALSFVEPFPLLVSGHETGWLCLWGIYPSMPLLHLFRIHIGAEDLQVPKPTTTHTLVSKKTQQQSVSPPSPVDYPHNLEHHHHRQQPDEDDELGQEVDEAILRAAVEIPTMLSGQEDQSEESIDSENDPSLPSPREEEKNQELPGSKEVGISTLQVFYDETGGESMTHEITRGRHMIFCGTSNGEICIFDISSVLQAARMRAIREESLPCNNGAYNPRRRFLRQGKHARSIQNQKKKQTYGQNANNCSQQEHVVRSKDIILLAKWKAHHGNIKSIRIVEEPKSIWTCSQDKTIKVWDFEGNCLGQLFASQEEVDSSNAENIKWKWHVDVESAAFLKKKHAEELWDTMKEEKLAKFFAVNSTKKNQVEPAAVSAIVEPELCDEAEGIETKNVIIQQESSCSSTSTFSSMADSQKLSIEPFRLEKNRVLAQIKGEVTWKKSDRQIAREIAWANETKKFDERMKTIMRVSSSCKKDKQQQQQQEKEKEKEKEDHSQQQKKQNQEAANFREVMDLSTTLVGNNSLIQLPSLDTIQLEELPFDDKDNWKVGSLNRQKSMYSNFYQENVRRHRVITSKRHNSNNRIAQLQKIDLTPSVFLLQKLGEASIIDENTQIILEKEEAKQKQQQQMRRMQLRTSASTTMLGSKKTLSKTQKEHDEKEVGPLFLQKKGLLLHQTKNSRHVQSMPERKYF